MTAADPAVTGTATGGAGSPGLAEVLALPGVVEHCELRSRVGFMAYHGGALEEMTDQIAMAAAERSGASCYAVMQPFGTEPVHISSARIDPAASAALAEFIDHVDLAITIHGFGRRGHFGSILVGGSNRDAADIVGRAIGDRLRAYRVITDLDEIPSGLRGLHERNPVNLPRLGGVQLELPPRVRGAGPLWWDHHPHHLVPHTHALIDALTSAARALVDQAR
jgi:phage replication-related protein YjqB (UPF0714/DUF867 family)